VKYRTIVADPPWPIHSHGARTPAARGNWNGKWERSVSVVPYEVMTVAEIAALPIEPLAETEAHLYLWTTNQFLEQAWSVVRAWGFQPSTTLTWCKAPMGLGFGGAFCITTEFCLFARRGSLKPLRREDSTWWSFPRPYNANGAPAHSAKPEAFLDMVERVSPGPYLELFARRNRLGWDTWGNESLEHVAIGETQR
jgi:N6-adenosine-specific RNA methylase IME4